MPRWLEFEDKNVEKAVNRACEELHIPKEKLKHDVISYGSSGIFGLVGTKKARIRVFLTDSEYPEPDIGIETTPRDYSAKGIPESPALPVPADIQPTKPEEPGEDPEAVGRSVLEKILEYLSTDASISIEKNSEHILFNIQGGNTAILIGKKGQTLEAVHYLVEKIVNKHCGDKIRIKIDVEDYLENRKNSLKRLAERLAQKSKRTGKPMTVGQMNAHDRRIVHLALKDDSEVKTQSMGEGYYRKLVIFPRRQGSQKRK